MKIFAIVPVKTLLNSKKRLSSILSSRERANLSEAMLLDVLAAVCNSEVDKVIVVSHDKKVMDLAHDFSAHTIYEEKELGVNGAVALANKQCFSCDASLVIPHDLPLLRPSDIDMICRAATEKQCVIVTPSQRYDGTNALLRKPHTAIKTHYDEDSYQIHIEKAKERKVPVKIFLNKRMMIDIDTPHDIDYFLKEKQNCVTSTVLEGLRPRLAG